MAATASMPQTIENLEQLMQVMSTPSDAVVKAVQELGGEFLVLGAGGKMGPTLCEMLVRAKAKRVIAVDLYPDTSVRDYLKSKGCETITANLLDASALKDLPEVPNVMIMAGFKFGSTGKEGALWAMNTLLPARVVERFSKARILLMSSGNVYKFAPVTGQGATEQDPVDPIGEYAQSRLGGERVASYVAESLHAKLVVVRLFYAVELRYGIIHDIANQVRDGKPIDITMGHVNQIWQGDAVGYLIQFLKLASSPAKVINITGQQVIPVREIAEKVGKIMGKKPVFVSKEADTALLGNSDVAFGHFGKPGVTPEQIIQWMAPWVAKGQASLGKPTKYDHRDGKF